MAYILSFLLISTIATLVAGDVFTPTAPGPGDSFKAGDLCEIRWTPSGGGHGWKNVTIILMSGPNNAMIPVTTVTAGLDGSDVSLSPYRWTCPEVTPYSNIYFYQFTDGGNTQSSQWTTRFTISSPSGETMPPEHASQPNGDAIPWGPGRLASHTDSSSNSTFTSTAPLDTQASSTSKSTKHPHHTKNRYGEDNEDAEDSSTFDPESTKMQKASKPTASLTATERQATPTISLPPDHSHPSSEENDYRSATDRYTGGQIAGKGHGLSPSMYAVMLVPLLVGLLS
ncbi:hypothetical protein Moror_7397 [Moniliophthora roreri MCA 2997]|uniref:Yeast cell wall synthesis Kre9/Knh1-like N-terminal domain-containing protein n=2 Tax=Moniliophthora roreri TaxID=221103 RepID=V2XQN8_MONRO|nr:hypothetical protein Moror_7397 [Moniliophthora roreri MCA 2997]